MWLWLCLCWKFEGGRFWGERRVSGVFRGLGDTGAEVVVSERANGMKVKVRAVLGRVCFWFL